MASKSVKRAGELSAKIFDCPEGFFTKYQMVKEKILGLGMSGEVVLASFRNDPEDKRAVKVFAKTEDNYNLFVTEAAVLGKISHPNVLPDVMAFRCPDSYMLCMPYYPGGSLRHQLPRLSDEQVQKYFLQLADAVLHLHANGVAHRDVKPDNVLVDESDDIILIDFGLAWQMSSGGDGGKVRPAGTQAYLPPEVNRQRTVDPFKCDLYALGVVLWNMLFKVVPEESCDYLGHVSHSRQMSLAYRILLHNLLHPDPSARWDANQLGKTLSGLPGGRGMARKFAGRSRK